MHEQTAVAAPKPLLRGWAHLVSFPVWMAVGVALVAVANVAASGRLLLAIYVLGTGTMFGVSAMYHRGRWQPQAKLLMQKFDRSAIFLAIAGGYTPIAFVSLDGWCV
ncbi:MAG: hemolysin III family protein [Acidimicrobiaceae bacterium]|nr:hemolysin III family protein [Acidimicrobiaceae bacterium]